MSNDSMQKSDQELTSAIQLLHELIPKDQIKAYSLRHSAATVYTTLTTLWMLTLQRLGGGKSLEAIVKETLMSHRDILPDNKRVRDGTLSKNSSAFSAARGRLSLDDAERFLDGMANSIIDSAAGECNGRRMFIIDGTTFKLPPTSELREVYPPASNQHGETVWPILMLTVAHELRSGAALRPEFGAMYGSKNTSESRQAMAIAKRIPSGSLILADAGYGIFSVVHAMLAAGHDVLFRLTKSRFKSMRRKADLIDQTGSSKRYRLSWTPSPKDRKTNPELADDIDADASLHGHATITGRSTFHDGVGIKTARLEVELHEIELDGGELLFLVASPTMGSEEAGRLYARRYDVEHDIRDLKVTLGVENIRAQTDEMVRKEMLCSMAAYNLVVQLRREAAKVAKLPPRRLSFTGVWNTMQSCLLHQSPGDLGTWKERYEFAISMASKDVLPHRPGRSSPRRAHPRRPKSTKFMKHRDAATLDPKTKTPPPDIEK